MHQLSRLRQLREIVLSPTAASFCGEVALWEKKDCVLDVTVVIPCNEEIFVAQDAYSQAKEVHILSNGNQYTAVGTEKRFVVSWKGHAQTRKDAIAQIQSKYTFFSVQDAFPVGNMMLTLVEALEKNDWDIVLPRQIPWPDVRPRDRQRLEASMPIAREPYRVPYADHVGALYRTEDLHSWVLADVPIAEDVWWSVGRTVYCMPTAKILHSHLPSPQDIFLRERETHIQLHTLGLLSPPKLFNGFSAICTQKNKKEIAAEVLGQIWGWWKR